MRPIKFRAQVTGSNEWQYFTLKEISNRRLREIKKGKKVLCEVDKK